jgi:hypothetical protein
MKTSTYSFGKFFWIIFLIIPFTLTSSFSNNHAAGVRSAVIVEAARAVGSIGSARFADINANAFAIARLKAAVRKANALRAATAKAAARKAELRLVTLEAAGLFETMQLQDSGLNEKALEYALLGYHRLLRKGVLHRSDVLSICDFSQSSSQRRMYVIDVEHRKLLYRTYVAHGINSGEEYASSFSNVPESNKSSLGFYVTRNAYFGSNGLSLRIDGVDRGFNNMASERNIVIHGAPYVSERILHKYGVMGTTFGCPAIPAELSEQIIPVLKNGSCFFIYYPSQRYLARSTVLNG